MSNSDKFLKRLLKLDTCAVSDALDGLGMDGAVTGIRQLSAEHRIAGRVMTVKLGSDQPVGGSIRHLCSGAIEAAGRGDIIVVEQLTGIDAAGWGGVLSTAAKHKGIAGVILEGPARDIDESRALGFPVYARYATARTARGRIFEQEYDCSITVGNVEVNPGDLVIADASAVVFIKAARAEDVLTAAELINAKEALMTVALLQGKPASEVMGADYESMLDKPE